MAIYVLCREWNLRLDIDMHEKWQHISDYPELEILRRHA
jgi:hypothetical protein